MQVGNVPNLNDGVVGYFNEQDLSTFYAPSTPIPLKSDPRSNALTLSMIVDPRAKITVAPGILPLKP